MLPKPSLEGPDNHCSCGCDHGRKEGVVGSWLKLPKEEGDELASLMPWSALRDMFILGSAPQQNPDSQMTLLLRICVNWERELVDVRGDR